MTEKRFYYNTFYYPNTDEIMEYEIIDRESFPNYPNHDDVEEIPDWCIYINANDSNWQDMCIDKLNELHEKKDILEVQLRSANNEIDKLMAEVNMLTDTCHDCCKEIREENKKLKQLIKKVMDERVVDYHLLWKIKEMVKE